MLRHSIKGIIHDNLLENVPKSRFLCVPQFWGKPLTLRLSARKVLSDVFHRVRRNRCYPDLEGRDSCCLHKWSHWDKLLSFVSLAFRHSWIEWAWNCSALRWLADSCLCFELFLREWPTIFNIFLWNIEACKKVLLFRTWKVFSSLKICRYFLYWTNHKDENMDFCTT